MSCRSEVWWLQIHCDFVCVRHYILSVVDRKKEAEQELWFYDSWWEDSVGADCWLSGSFTRSLRSSRSHVSTRVIFICYRIYNLWLSSTIQRTVSVDKLNSAKLLMDSQQTWLVCSDWETHQTRAVFHQTWNWCPLHVINMWHQSQSKNILTDVRWSFITLAEVKTWV